MVTRQVTGAMTTEIVTLAQSPFGAKSSRMVSARLPLEQWASVSKAAAVAGVTLGAYCRGAIAKLTTGPGPAPGTLRDLITALGLPKDSQPEQVLEAVQALVAELLAAEAPPDADPLAQQVDQPQAKLSAADRATAARITDPKRRALYLQLRTQHQANLTRKHPK